MAGHSKWANIKHRKAAQDAKRGKLFTKLIRELVVAARVAGSGAEDNPRLRAAIDKALTANMKRDTIDNAIARGAGNSEAENMEELTYEGYGPAGVAVLIEAMTDNRNRTVAEVRHAFSKVGGKLGTDGSVAYLFSRMGLIQFPDGLNEESILEVGLEVGANDIVALSDGTVEVLTPWEHVADIRCAFVKAGLEPVNSEVTMLASNEVMLDAKTAPVVIGLIDVLEDLDDVQNVFHNADIPEEVLASL